MDAAPPPCLRLAAHTGMRRGEIVGLKWNDLSVARPRLSVSRTLQNVGGRPAEFGVKTRTSRRSVELNRCTVDELRRRRRQLERDGLPCGPDDWCSAIPLAGSSTPSRSASSSNASSDGAACRASSGSTTCATPTLAPRRRRRVDQGRHRTPRPRPPSLDHGDLPAPRPRHEQRRRRTLRHHGRRRRPVDVYWPIGDKALGHRLAR